MSGPSARGARGAGPSRAAVLAAAMLLIAGCQAKEVRRDLTVGSHRFSVAVPRDWQVLDLGRDVLLRHGATQVAFSDRGPAGAVGIRREVERARALWRQGRAKDALWRMRRVPVPAALFTTAEQRQAFWVAWSGVSDAREDLGDAAIDPAFDHVLAAISTLEDRSLDALADDALSGLGEDQRRDVASRGRRVVDGRPAVVLDTWYRLTHQGRRRYVLVFDDGYVLALRTDEGAFVAAAVPLETLIESLRFARTDLARVASPAVGVTGR